MKVIFVIVFLYFIPPAFASNYYFSSVSGNDSRTNIEAQDPATPWKTLEKLNSFFSSLRPGDSVLLKRDEIFYGSVIVQKSGSITFPIVIGAYGSGNKPVITSLVTLTGWVSKGKGIWESFDSTLGETINMVLLNGVQAEMGRYPNSNAPNKGYLNYESHVGKTSITDNELTSSINWKGAELVTRPRHWILNRSLITGHAGNTISYTTTSPYEPYENYGYFIQNSIKTLDKIGEWYYNPVTKKFSAYFGTKGPSSYVMQAATTNNNLVSSLKYSNVTFDNLVIEGSNNCGFNIGGGGGIRIQNCDILYSGITGILVGGHSRLRVENCTIDNSNNNAIDMKYSVKNAVIKNNRILNTGVVAGMMQNGEGNGLAIYVNGDGNTIESNEIRNTGFIGITFYGNDLLIKNNFVDSFCFVKDDGGGIYSHGGTIVNTNRKIIGNIVINGVGAGPGTDIYDKRSVTGIYMDADITDVEITDNTVTTCFQGIFIQSSAGMVIKNNTVYDNMRQLTIIERAGDNPVRNSLVTHNIFFSKSPDQWLSYIMSSGDDIKLFGTFDSNYYARPLDEKITIFNSYVGEKGTVTQSLDLNGWQKVSDQDKHSKKTFKQIVPYKINSLIGANKFVDGGDFTTDVKGVFSSACEIPWSNSGMLDGGYIQVTPSARVSSLFFKVGLVTAGKNYILNYSLKGSVENDMSIGATLKQTASPFTALTPVQNRKIAKARTENQMLFTPTATQTSNVVFKVDAQSNYYLDNIKFYEVNAKVTKPDDSIRFEYNATNVNKTILLNGNYVDPTGKLYLKKIVLRPCTSAVLLRTGANVKNIPPTVSITSPVNKEVFDSHARIAVNVSAADVDGTIAKVEFYNGSTLLKTDEDAVFDCALDSLAPGNYKITAKATDNNDVTTTSAPIVFSVVPANVAPVVSIITPANDAAFEPFPNVLISAVATDTDGSVTKVEFYNDSTLLKTTNKPPYNFTLNNLSPGNYKITAKATDNKGLAGISAPVAFLVYPPNVAPTVNITSPANNAIFSPFSNVVINAAAADVGGSIAKVEFYNDSVLLKTSDKAPYNCTLDKLAPGSYTITAKATDNRGWTDTSSVIFTVGTVNIRPTVNITYPANNADFRPFSTVIVTADAADTDGTVSKVQFYKGSTLLKTELKPPYDCTLDSLPPGNYTITVKATDNNGRTTTSSPVVLWVGDPNVAPTVSITTPANNEVFKALSTIVITAAAADIDGSVEKVEFYSGSILLKTEYGPVYTCTLDSAAPGRYIITAKATDNRGLVTVSSPVAFTVSALNIAPTVSITAPANNAIFNPLSTVVITAEAADIDGSVAKVEFYNGSTLLITEHKAPYDCILDKVAPGIYTITVKATDNKGLATTSSPVVFTVAESNAAPVVNITAPANNATFKALSTVVITADATDVDGSVEKVEFYNGSTLLKTAYGPLYTCTLTNVAAGIYTVTAKATDNKGLVTASSAVVFTVTPLNVAPTVSITAPSNNAVFKALSSVVITAEAADVDGSVAKVEFYNGSTLLIAEHKAPYDCILDKVAPGIYTIIAKATDDKGKVTASSPVVFTVTALKVAPAISITTPADSAVYLSGANVSLNAIASDADGTISKVEFYEGTNLLHTATDTPYTFKWAGVHLGNYTITAKATDDSGLVTTSAEVHISVVPNKPPIVNITSPTNNQTFSEGATVRLRAVASDSDGRITRVEFYDGTTLLTSKYNEGPYTFNWTNALPGNHTITAKAFDNWGAITTSSAVSISVASNKAPSVSIVSPATGKSVTAPGSIEIVAAATDADGSISKVEFFNGSTLLDTRNVLPYTFTWKNVAAGNYTITAKSTDNNGLATTSAGVQLSVEAQSASRGSSSSNASSNVSNASSTIPAAGVSPATTELESSPAENGNLVMQPGLSALPDFRLSPDPAVSMIRVTFNAAQVYRKATLVIKNSSGAIIKKYPVIISGKKIDVDISSLQPGIYIIGLSGNNFSINKKFLKVN